MNINRRAMQLFQPVAILMFLLIGSQGVFAQQARDSDGPGWGHIHNLPAGQKLKILLIGGPRVKGRLVELSDDSIILRRKKKEVEIFRDEVFQVLARRKFHRGKRIVKATGKGALFGLALPFFWGGDEVSGEGIVIGVILAPFTATGGAIIGVIRGATVKPKYDLVYQTREVPWTDTQADPREEMVQP